VPGAGAAQVRKRGKDFWAEFEFYLSDLIVGIVLDVVLVTLMAPAAQLGPRAARTGGAPLPHVLRGRPEHRGRPSVLAL
jgi:hypothetical protein